MDGNTTRPGIILMGLPGSGKTTAAGFIASKGFPHLEMSDYVAAQCKRFDAGTPQHLFAGYPYTLIMAQLPAAVLSPRPHSLPIVVSGLRSMNDYAMLGVILSPCLAFWIETAPSVRYDRLMRRTREDSPKTLRDCVSRDKREQRWGVGELKAVRDVTTITNNGDLSALREQVERFAQGVL